MTQPRADVELLTSARMAAGMTSRARRPQPAIPLGSRASPSRFRDEKPSPVLGFFVFGLALPPRSDCRIRDETLPQHPGLVPRRARRAARAGGASSSARRAGGALEGKSIALVFFNPSLRTRTSFELGAFQLGGHAVVLQPGKDAWPIEFDLGAVMDGDAEEHVAEVARVLSRYVDLIGVRAFPKFHRLVRSTARTACCAASRSTRRCR